MPSGCKYYPLSGLPLPAWSSEAQLWEARQVPTRVSLSGAAFLNVELHSFLLRLQPFSLRLLSLPPWSLNKGVNRAVYWVLNTKKANKEKTSGRHKDLKDAAVTRQTWWLRRGEVLTCLAPRKSVASLGRARRVHTSSFSALIIRQALPTVGSVG